jgi:hypothetical protein
MQYQGSSRTTQASAVAAVSAQNISSGPVVLTNAAVASTVDSAVSALTIAFNTLLSALQRAGLMASA